MKIVGIMGSPRKQGNTAVLFNQVMEGAKAAGGRVTVFYPNEMNIRGCQGCEACKTKGHCVVRDDMREIYRAIDQADLLVLASPVYMWAMSAQLKLVVDRLYAYLKADYTSAMTNSVRLGMIFTHHRAEAGDFMPYFHSVADILKLIGFKPADDILVGAGMHELGQVGRDHALLAKAYQYGRYLCG